MIMNHCVRRILCLSLLSFVTMAMQAQTMKVRDVFRQMPDSILPYLTENNRLDMLDFMDSHMKARVQNKFDGYSEMLTLTDDSLTIQMSSMMRLTISLLSTTKEIDGAQQLICLKRTVGDSSKIKQTICSYYSVLWQKLDDKLRDLVK